MTFDTTRDVVEPLARAYGKAIVRIETLEAELRNIANANLSDFSDYHEFKVWAQNRARHAVAAPQPMTREEEAAEAALRG